ncbi:hypothetical protein CEQ90_06790 [Lewinellaceae bacterium SD302]|nr:hypothetical protein CEQ90_06790 [Lewinellaceae bacterium SD302]
MALRRKWCNIGGKYNLLIFAKISQPLHRLSSNATLFYKIFLPVFWTTVVLLATLALWLAPEHYFGGLPLESLRWAMLLLLVAGSATFWLLFWPLKRVEANNEYVYVSNYFKAARYRWDTDVERLSERNLLLFRFGILELKGSGLFGSSVRFLVSKKLLESFRNDYPGLV